MCWLHHWWSIFRQIAVDPLIFAMAKIARVSVRKHAVTQFYTPLVDLALGEKENPHWRKAVNKHLIAISRL